MRDAEHDITAGVFDDLPMPESIHKIIHAAMVEALIYGYWLSYLFVEEQRDAADGRRKSRKVTLSDITEDELRNILSSALGGSDDWHRVIPEDAVNWLKGYTPKLAGVLEKDVLEKVRDVVQQSMYDGSTLKDRVKALYESSDTIKGMAERRVAMIARTEVTRASTMGNLIQMKQNPDVLGVEFCAILDPRVTDICEHRDGLIMRIDDPRLPYNTPPLHVGCRSLLTACTTWDYPDGMETSPDFDNPALDPSLQRPEDVQVVRELLQAINPAVKVKPEIKLEVKPEPKVEAIELNKLKKAMADKDYENYSKIISEHENHNIRKLYKNYADKISFAEQVDSGSAYDPNVKSLSFRLCNEKEIANGRNPYSVLAHEYGHAFDPLAKYSNLTHNEIDKFYQQGLNGFEKRASQSDAFLTAIRRDKSDLKEKLGAPFEAIKADLFKSDSSNGVQDTLDGFFDGAKIGMRWGHGNNYYNRRYPRFIERYGHERKFKKALTELGIDVKTTAKLKDECRVYETASEAWAHIASAVTVGGESLEYIKKYLPNSYKAFMEILEGVI